LLRLCPDRGSGDAFVEVIVGTVCMCDPSEAIHFAKRTCWKFVPAALVVLCMDVRDACTL
jgi:hypothetical protein